MSDTKTEQTPEHQVSTKFADIRTQIDHYAAENAKLVFDYEDAKGNKDARSHVHKLRSLNGMIDKAHKVIKADVLAQSRLIDAAKKELKGKVAEMIDLHHAPIKAIEDREAKRIQEIEEAFRILRVFKGDNLLTNQSMHKVYVAELNRLCDIVVDEAVYQERTEEAKSVLEESIDKVQQRTEEAQKYEAEQKELEELRKKTAEQERQLREQQIREEAAAKAKKDAEEAAQRKIDEANAEAEAAKKKLEQTTVETVDKIIPGMNIESEAYEQQAVQFINDNAGKLGWIAVSLEDGSSVTFGKNGITRTKPTKG